MNITDDAKSKMKTLVVPNSGLAEGIRIAQGSGCCGPVFKVSIVKQPYFGDIKEVHDGINVYLDDQLKDYNDEILIDCDNSYFKISGIVKDNNSGCC